MRISVGKPKLTARQVKSECNLNGEVSFGTAHDENTTWPGVIAVKYIIN